MKISIIIPALNEAHRILGSLDSITRQQGEFEIIVIDGNSVDATADIARPHAKVINSRPGRAAQMNVGAQQACGDVLLFLHADSRLPRNAIPLLKRTLADARVMGGTFRLRFDTPKPLLNVIAFSTRFRFRYFHYGDQGIFVRRSVFERLRGFSEIPIMEDIDFLRRMRKTGKVTLIGEPVTTSARRFLRRGIVRQQLLDIILVILYRLGVSPDILSNVYRATDSRSTTHP